MNCYNCKSKENTFFTSENGYNLVECLNCKLLFVENPPSLTQITNSTIQGVHKGNEAINVQGSFDELKIEMYKTILLDLYTINELKDLNWLDVGCGYGEFLLSIKSFSDTISLKGSEPNTFKRDFAVKKGLDVGFFEIEDLKEKYEVISLLNVYSHLPNPVEFLTSLKNKLTEKGELIIETGDRTFYNSKNIPKPLYLPDHLSFTTEKNLKKMLEDIGFSIISIKKYPILKLNVKTFIKEFIKLLSPVHKTRIRYFFSKKALIESDMYIRAKLK